MAAARGARALFEAGCSNQSNLVTDACLRGQHNATRAPSNRPPPSPDLPASQTSSYCASGAPPCSAFAPAPQGRRPLWSSPPPLKSRRCAGHA